MAEEMIRQCGAGWAYCDGECKSCIEVRIITTNHTYDYCMANNANGYMYVVDNIEDLKQHKTDGNSIAEAVGRTKKYIHNITE